MDVRCVKCIVVKRRTAVYAESTARYYLCVCVGGLGIVLKKTNELYRRTGNARKRWKQTEWHLIFYDTTHTRHARGFAVGNILFPDRADYRRFSARTSTGARAQRNRGTRGREAPTGGGGWFKTEMIRPPMVGKKKWGTCPWMCVCMCGRGE